MRARSSASDEPVEIRTHRGGHAKAKARHARLIGIVLMCGAVGTFACLDTTAKYLGRQIDVMQVVWARYTFALLLALVVANPISRPGLLRRAAGIAGWPCGRAARLDHVQFLRTEIYAARPGARDHVFDAVLCRRVVRPGAGRMVGPRRWAAIGVGFIGILVVTRPGFGLVIRQ